MGSSNIVQFGFSQVDGSSGPSGGNALTPHAGQIGDTSSSSVWSQRSLMTTVWPVNGPLR